MPLKSAEERARIEVSRAEYLAQQVADAQGIRNYFETSSHVEDSSSQHSVPVSELGEHEEEREVATSKGASSSTEYFAKAWDNLQAAMVNKTPPKFVDITPTPTPDATFRSVTCFPRQKSTNHATTSPSMDPGRSSESSCGGNPSAYYSGKMAEFDKWCEDANDSIDFDKYVEYGAASSAKSDRSALSSRLATSISGRPGEGSYHKIICGTDGKCSCVLDKPPRRVELIDGASKSHQAQYTSGYGSGFLPSEQSSVEGPSSGQQHNSFQDSSHNPIFQLPEIAALVHRLVDAKLDFTREIVMGVIVIQDCWNATAFIHALRAREKCRSCNMLETLRTSLDAAMDIVIVELAETLINEFQIDRGDVLDAI
eukprot:gene40356-49909_t